MASNHTHRESLEEQLRNLITEARIVLPGVQAILGFQLIAVFNERFAHELTRAEQILHVTAFFLIAVAIGLIMTPAANAQMSPPQARPGSVTWSGRRRSRWGAPWC